MQTNTSDNCKPQKSLAISKSNTKLKDESSNPISKKIASAPNPQGKAIKTQENLNCSFCEIFLRVTESGSRAIGFKLLLQVLINQGLSVVDILHLLSTNKALIAEIENVNWLRTWTKLNDRDVFLGGNALNSHKQDFENNPGRLKFSLQICYSGIGSEEVIDSRSLNERIDKTIEFFNAPANSLYLRNCRLFEIDLWDETLNLESKIWEFVKKYNLKLALVLALNHSDQKGFDPCYSFIKNINARILDNIRSFQLRVAVGTKNLDQVNKLIGLIQKCKNLAHFGCGTIGAGVTFMPTQLNLDSFSCGNISEKACLQLNPLKLTYFKCHDIESGSILNLKNLEHLRSFICNDIFQKLQIKGFKALTIFKCEHIRIGASVELQDLPNLATFECGNVEGWLTLDKRLKNLNSFKCGNITLIKVRNVDSYKTGELRFSAELPSLTFFECGDIEGSVFLNGPMDKLVSFKCGNLKQRKIQTPKNKPTKGRTQANEYYPQNSTQNGQLSFPSNGLPNLTILQFKDIELNNSDYKFRLPKTHKLENILFGEISDAEIRNELIKLRNNLKTEQEEKNLEFSDNSQNPILSESSLSN